jgi:Tol biopolymer transport system component
MTPSIAKQTFDPFRSRRLGALLIGALALLALTAGCAGDDEAEPTGRIVALGSLIPAAGGEVERLRFGDFFSSAAFSPDGKTVAITTDPDGITLVALDTGRRTVVPNQPSQQEFLSYDVQWTPDGRTLAFQNGDSIFTISVDGNDLRELVRGSFPSWTPDGKQIVFVVGDWRGPELPLATIGADGTGLRTLGGRGVYPDVSPSGEEVAYSTSTGVFVRPIDGGPPRLVVPDGFGPVWSPDGKFIAFTRYTSCPSDGDGACSGRVFVVPAGGGEPHPVGPTVGDPAPPDDWIP